MCWSKHSHGFITWLRAILHSTFHHRQLDHIRRHCLKHKTHMCAFILCKHTSGKHRNTSVLHSTDCALITVWSVVTGSAAVLTRLLFYCIQDPFNNFIQFRGTDRLQHFHKVPAGLTGAQNNKKASINCCSFFLLTAGRKLEKASFPHENACQLALTEKTHKKQLKLLKFVSFRNNISYTRWMPLNLCLSDGALNELKCQCSTERSWGASWSECDTAEVKPCNQVTFKLKYKCWQ